MIVLIPECIRKYRFISISKLEADDSESKSFSQPSFYSHLHGAFTFLLVRISLHNTLHSYRMEPERTNAQNGKDQTNCNHIFFFP